MKRLFIILFVVFGFLAFPSNTFAATYTVTKTADTNDGTCDADCSLREAVASANANSGLDSVTFNISTGDANYNSTDDTWTITLGSVLSISTNQSISIDGSTQTGTTAIPTYGGKIVLLTSTNVQTLTATGGTSDVTLNHLTLKNTSATTQIMIGGTTASLTIQNCYVTRDVQTSANNTAIAPTATGSVIFSNNKIDSYNRGFQSTNTTNSSATTTVDSNLLVGATSIGLRPTGYNLTVTNNTISDSNQGIIASCTGGTCLVNTNTITGSNTSHFSGISASGVGTFQISGNTINTSHWRAIDLASAATIQNNIISGNGGTANTTNGKIHIDTNDTSKSVTVTNNTISVSDAIPIWVNSASTRATIRSNVISSSIQYAPINLSGGTENTNLITQNDAQDTDAGVNSLMNYPKIEWAEYIGNHQYEVYGSLDGNSSESPFTIELCKSNNHSSGHGGCEQSMGTTSLSSQGGWSMTVTIAGDDAEHLSYFSALATNSAGSTSEFGGTVRARVRGETPLGNPRQIDLLAYEGGIVTKGDIVTIVQSRTFRWDMYLDTLETLNGRVFRISGSQFWQASSVHRVTWRSFYNDAEVLAKEMKSPFILSMKYNPITLEKSLRERSLRLAYSTNGTSWKVTNSVLDIKNKTVAILTKQNGYYMLVASY
jgi:CSLREA domain-containing protein